MITVLLATKSMLFFSGILWRLMVKEVEVWLKVLMLPLRGFCSLGEEEAVFLSLVVDICSASLVRLLTLIGNRFISVTHFSTESLGASYDSMPFGDSALEKDLLLRINEAERLD